MKPLFWITLALAFASAAQAGPLGWMTAKKRDWNFVQQVGGIRIAAPKKSGNQWILPVEFFVQGTVAITCQPTLLNSGLAVRRIAARRIGQTIVIQVITQIVESGSDVGRFHDVALGEIPPGTYEVYYENAGDPQMRLGAIKIE